MPESVAPMLERAKWAIQFPALSVMVFLRRDIGYRRLNPLALIGIAVVMLVFSALFRPESRPEDLMIFTVVMLALGTGQRLARWRQIRQGVKQHSFYPGTSCFDADGVPKFLRQNGRANYIVDPAVCIVAGFLLVNYSRALATWLILSGLCLRFYEYFMFRRDVHQMLDTVDGLVTSTVQSDIVEHFENDNGTARREPSQGVPTGLGNDIREQIERRKNDRPS